MQLQPHPLPSPCMLIRGNVDDEKYHVLAIRGLLHATSKHTHETPSNDCFQILYLGAPRFCAGHRE